MVKRYVKEYANDKKSYFKSVTDNVYSAFCQYSDKVISLTEKGYITNDEAIKMLSSIDTWELSSEEYKNRFLNW